MRLQTILRHSIAPLALLLVTTQAGAQTAPPPAFSWTGFYLGTNRGFGGGDLTPNLGNATSGFIPTAVDTSLVWRMSGWSFGGQLGYNYQLANRLVLGLETDIQWSSVAASSHDAGYSVLSLAGLSAGNQVNTVLSLNQNWFGTTRGRLGYAILDGVLVYATGGVAYSGFDLKSGNTTLTAATGGAPIFMRTYGASSPTAVGFVVGGGVELAISGNLSVQGEYIYQQYPGFTLPLPTIGFGTTTSGVGNFSTNAIGIHMLRFGVNQRFNDPQELLSNPLNSPMITGVLARPVVDWSGFYIGVNGGYGGGVLEPQLTQLNSGSFPGIGLGVPEAVYTQDLAAWRHGGFLAGGQIGYNHQFQNNFIVGVESDFDWSGVSASNHLNSVSFAPSPPTPSLTSTLMRQSIDEDWFGSTRLRLGHTVYERGFAYITGGVVYSQYSLANSGGSATATSVFPFASVTQGRTSAAQIGWGVGAGCEHALNDHWRVRADYLYSEVPALNLPFATVTAGLPTSATFGQINSGTIGTHRLRFGLDYALGPAPMTLFAP